MRRIGLATIAVIILGTVTAPWAATFYLHESASPVPVPGGSTMFVLSDSPPAVGTPVVEQLMLPKGTTASLPSFIAPAFPAPTPLGLDFELVLHLSANHRMRQCAIVSATIERVATDGTRSRLARTGPLAVTIPQGAGGGTTGFAPVSLGVSQGSCDGPFEDVVIAAGESIAVTVTLSSTCKSNRSVSLAFDSASAPGGATFDPLPPPDPVQLTKCFSKCQASTSKATVKLAGATTKCILKCEGNALKGRNPFSECDFPYAGATAECIAEPEKGAIPKAIAAIEKACAFPRPCPPCYAGGDCEAFAALHAGVTGQAYGALTSLVLCEETLEPTRAKCMSGAGNALSKFTSAKMKCYDKCYASVAKGKIPAAECTPPASDFATAECVAKAEEKAVAAVGKVCPVFATPPCFPPGVGTDLVAVGEGLADGFSQIVYCGSPSGAFLDGRASRRDGSPTAMSP